MRKIKIWGTHGGTSRHDRIVWKIKKTSYRYTLNPIYLKKNLTVTSEYYTL